MIYESCAHSCVPDSVIALLQRFDNITLRIWERIGPRSDGFVTTLVGPYNQDLTFFLPFGSSDEPAQQRNRFAPSPEGQAARQVLKAEHGEMATNIAPRIPPLTEFPSIKWGSA